MQSSQLITSSRLTLEQSIAKTWCIEQATKTEKNTKPAIVLIFFLNKELNTRHTFLNKNSQCLFLFKLLKTFPRVDSSIWISNSTWLGAFQIRKARAPRDVSLPTVDVPLYNQRQFARRWIIVRGSRKFAEITFDVNETLCCKRLFSK